jgi:hypothetical protein
MLVLSLNPDREEEMRRWLSAQRSGTPGCCIISVVADAQSVNAIPRQLASNRTGLERPNAGE